MIDFYATEPHFIDHMAPVWAALPASARGDFIVHRALHDRAISNGIRPGMGDVKRPVLTASWGDYKRARSAGRDRIAYIEHGAGQSYAGDPRSADSPGYSGGRARDPRGLFLAPNEYSAERWRAAYPEATVRTVGCPKVETLPQRVQDGIENVVAVSFHWPCGVAPEAGTAFTHYRPSLAGLAARYNVIGHGHPRSLAGDPWLRQSYARLRITRVDDFRDVCRMADVYVCDNSSSMFEFAATGRPVVVLNQPRYRRDVDHGGRFWDWATVGIQVDDPADLLPAVGEALRDSEDLRAERERIVDLVYPIREGSAALAAGELMDWAGVEVVADAA